jgi:hypothetical protein
VRKMEEESFCGQSSIELSEIERRLRNTESLIGNKDEIRQFIESGFNRFGCKKTDNFDATYRLEVNDNNLVGRSLKMS